MKVLKGFITMILVLIILSGVGYLVWNAVNMKGMSINLHNKNNISQNSIDGNSLQNSTDNNNMTNMNNTPNMSNSSTNAVIAVENKEKLTQIIKNINEAFNLITIDPYSKVTLPSSINKNTDNQTRNGTVVNIYPNNNGNNQTGNNPPQSTNNNQNTLPTSKFVFNQSKLEQLHSGIFKFAEGMMIINSLNDDLTVQASKIDTATTYESYINRYNIALQNKNKLNKALSTINEASVLININPYASNSGYEYNSDEMEKFHRGVYMLAQGMLSGVKFSDDLTKQMMDALSLANNSNINMPVSNSFNLFNFTIELPNIIRIVTIFMIIIFIILLFTSVSNILKVKTKK